MNGDENTMNITLPTENGTITYFNVSTCQNSNENCICSLRNNGIELPISETGECRVQLYKPSECDSYF